MQNSPNEGNEKPRQLEDLIALQTSAIKRLEEHFAPESIEEIEERRMDRLRALIVRAASISALAVSGILGAWEFGLFIKESWEVRETAANYADVGVRLYYEENNVAVAKEFLEKALELSPDDANFLYLDAYIDGMSEVRRLFNLDRPYTADELDAAYRALAKSILLEQQDPSGPEAFILRGQIYAALKERDRAVQALEKAISIDPANDFATMRLGVVEYGEGKRDAAMGHFDKALSLNPESKWAHLWKGIVYSEERALEESRIALNEALRLDPRFDLALYNLGWVELKEKKKNYVEAEKLFRRALSVNPSYKEALYGLAMVYGYQNQYETAHGYLSQALELDVGFLTAWKWRGIVNYEMKDFPAAIEDFSKGLALDPANSDLFVRRARVSILSGQFEKALDDLLLAKKFDEKNHRIYRYLGQVYSELNRLDIAVEVLKTALDLKPNDGDAYANLGEVYLKKGLARDAEESYRAALSSTEYRLERFAVPLSSILLDRGDYASAFELLSPLAEKVDNPEVWYQLFSASLFLGDIPRATEALSSYIRLNPASEKIDEMRTKIFK